MKRIVLSEGKRDVRLVECFYSHATTEYDVKRFIAERVEYSRLKNQETTAIRNFLEPRNPYDVLAKSENGKPDLKQIFVKLCNFLIGTDADLCLLIDLDGSNDVADLFSELHRRVRDNYDGQAFHVQQADILDRSDDLIAVRGELATDSAVRGLFDVLAFRTNLEDAADIRDGDSSSTEETKLRSFVGDERRSSPMRQVL